MAASVVLLMRRETVADQVCFGVVHAAAAAVVRCEGDTMLQQQRRQQAHLFSFDTM
jgi:hypothetical protein